LHDLRLPEKPSGFSMKTRDGHVVVTIADLIPDAVTPCSSSSDSICAGARKRINNYIPGKAEHPDQPFG
jgi:hypothetical protein